MQFAGYLSFGPERSLLTSNTSCSAWGAIFAGNHVIASAILEGLFQHSTTIDIRGESYRLKDQHRARLIRPLSALSEEGHTMA
jgi:IstB-like ATP binding protein